MAEPGGGELSRQTFQVAYHGADAGDHTMDVDVLAPALMAFGKLIREANFEINGDRAAVKVLVDSDFEHKCFHINFEIIQSLIQRIKDLLKDDNVETATSILQTIGVIAAPIGTICGSLLAFLKLKRGRKIKSVVRDADSGGTVLIRIEGDHNSIQVTDNVFKLAKNKKVLDAIEGSLAPIEAKQAVWVEFKQDDKAAVTYGQEAVREIISSCELGPEDVMHAVAEEGPKPKITVATLYSYGPVFDPKAKNWRFKYKNKPIYVDVSETSIGKDTMRRGGSLVDDRYRVRMEVTASDTEGGDSHYKILEILDFTQGHQQHALPLRKPSKKKKKK